MSAFKRQLKRLTSKRSLHSPHPPFDDAASPTLPPETPPISRQVSETQSANAYADVGQTRPLVNATETHEQVSAVDRSLSNSEAAVGDIAMPVPSTTANGRSHSGHTEDGEDTRFEETWRSVQREPAEERGFMRSINAFEDKLSPAADAGQLVANNQKGIASTAGQLVNDLGVKQAVDGFMRGMPVFMDALDEVARLHPFVGAVIVVFKAAYTLEVKRRDNDRKIAALFSEMKDVMDVLLQLKHMRKDDPRIVRPDGSALSGVLNKCLIHLELDVKECSLVCDTYSKKITISKIAHAPFYNLRFAEFVQTFQTRRSELIFTLNVRTAVRVEDINTKLDALMDLFANSLAGPELRTLTKKFEEVRPEPRGRSAIQHADKDSRILSLITEARKFDDAPVQVPGGGEKNKDKDKDKTDTRYRDLEKALEEDPEETISGNRVVFEGTLKLQMKALEDIIHREGQWIVKAVGEQATKGVHDKLLNQDVRSLWIDQKWKGTVETRYLVVALRDHFTEQFIIHKPDPDVEWAVKCIDIKNVQSIVEAMDEDASGFITIGEMNSFTESLRKPKDWNLVTWIAYWAVGWKPIQRMYAKKIQRLAAQMIRLSSHVLPLNRDWAVEYLRTTSHAVYTLAGPFLKESQDDDDDMPEVFKRYAESQESEMKEKLATVGYAIDGPRALDLVLGGGRIEKNALVLLYLLLERHTSLFKAAQQYTLAFKEIFQAGKVIESVQSALTQRIQDLTDSFQQQRLDIDAEFDKYACGLFRLFNTPSLCLTEDMGILTTFPEAVEEDDTGSLEDTLQHPHHPFQKYVPPYFDDWIDDSKMTNTGESMVSDEDMSKNAFLGTWTGKETYESSTASLQTIRLWLVDGVIKGEHRSSRGIATIKGSVEATDNKEEAKINIRLEFDFAMKTPAASYGGRADAPDAPEDTTSGTADLGMDWELVDFLSFSVPYGAMAFVGTYTPGAKEIMSGSLYGSGIAVSLSPQVVYRRMAPEHYAFYPCASIAPQGPDLARQRWRFALDSVQHCLRRQRWAWSFFKGRRDQRRAFLEHATFQIFASTGERRAKQDNWEEKLRLCTRSMLPDDGCYYFVRLRWSRAINRAQYPYTYMCNACGDYIQGARLWCLDCWKLSIKASSERSEVPDSYDLCNQDPCINITPGTEAYVVENQPKHARTHQLILVRAGLQWLHYSPFADLADEYHRYVIKYILESLSAAASKASTGDAGSRIPKCWVCSAQVESPLWYHLEPWSESWKECCVCSSCMRNVDTELRDPLQASGIRARAGTHEEGSAASPAEMLRHRYIFMRCVLPSDQGEEEKTPSQVATETQLAALQKSLADAVDRLTNLEMLIQELKSDNSSVSGT